MDRLQKIKITLAGVTLAALAACGGGGGSDGVGVAGTGTVRLAMTDAPSCGYDEVNVTVEKVRVHKSGGASDNDAGWSEVVLNPAKRINLLNLTNGVLEELGQTSLPEGKYTQLRMILSDNPGNPNATLANSVKLTGGGEFALKTPSGQQSGVKANVNMDIVANKLSDLVIDFDACKSIVTAGGQNKYLLKPVVAVIPRYASGVSGFVASSLVNGSTTVSLQQAGVVVKATTPDSTGKFVLQPAAPGNYTLVFTASGFATKVVTSVPVAADSVTVVNTVTSPISLPASATGTVTGNAPVDTSIRALQTLTSAGSIQVSSRFVDGVTGNYSFQLPVDAPLVGSYAAAPASITFAADTAAAGKYSLSASLAGFTDKVNVLTSLPANGTLTSNFTFP